MKKIHTFEFIFVKIEQHADFTRIQFMYQPENSSQKGNNFFKSVENTNNFIIYNVILCFRQNLLTLNARNKNYKVNKFDIFGKRCMISFTQSYKFLKKLTLQICVQYLLPILHW